MKRFDCALNGCNATFTLHSSLKRHQRTIHEKIPRARPRKNTDRSYKCSKCPKTFARLDVCRRHEKTVHGEGEETTHSRKMIQIKKPEYICAYCELRVSRKDILLKHIYTQHDNNEYFKCHDCGRNFKHKYSLRKHIFNKHIKIRACIKKPYQCILCQGSFELQKIVREHLVEQHNINLDAKTQSFSSMQEFLEWKKELEDATITRFPIDTRVKNRNQRTVIVYNCHRSRTRANKPSRGKRAPFLRGSKKLNGVCPASIILRENNDSSYTATFFQTHLGHSTNDLKELKFTFLHKEDRQKLAGLVATGVPKSQILDQVKGSGSILDGSSQTKVVRMQLLSNKDLCNIEASFNVKSNRRPVVPQNHQISELTEVQEAIPLTVVQEAISPSNTIDERTDTNIHEEPSKKSTKFDEAMNGRLTEEFTSLLSKVMTHEEQIMIQNTLNFLKASVNAKKDVEVPVPHTAV